MVYLYASILTLLNLCWLALVLIGLPGTWLMLATTALLAWWQGDMFSLWTLGIVLVLAIIGEVLEFFAGVVGTKRAGGSRWGAAGAIVGCIIGGIVATFLIPIPVLGTLIGACGGAALGAWLMELASGKEMRLAVRSGIGGVIGRLLGTLAKLGIGSLIWLILAVAAFWP